MSAVPAKSYHSSNGTSGMNFSNNKFTILLIIIVVLLITGIPQRVYYEYKAYRDEKIVNYLKVSKEYTLFLHQEISPIFNSNTLPNQSVLYELQVQQLNFKQEILRLKPPKYFEGHYDILLEIAVRDENILKQLAKLDANQLSAVNALINLNNEAYERLSTELKQALTNNEIPYVELEDGWIEYEITVTDEYKRYKYEQEKNDFIERLQNRK